MSNNRREWRKRFKRFRSEIATRRLARVYAVFVGKRNLSVISRFDLSRRTIRKCHAINTTFASLVVRLLASSPPLFRYVGYCSNVRVTKQWFINPFSSQAYIIRAIFLASITRAQFSLSLSPEHLLYLQFSDHYCQSVLRSRMML